MRKTICLDCVLVMLLVVLMTVRTFCADPQVFGSFENPSEVAAIRASAGVQFRQSTRFPAWEGNSLEVVFPGLGGSIVTSRIPAEWRWQESLLVFVWSLQPGQARVEVMDTRGARSSKSFPLRAGVNHLQWPLAEMKGLDRKSIGSLKLEADRQGTWYVDYIALDRDHPVLRERGRWDINYSMEVETPHVPWARPLSGGPIRTFAIADVTDGRGVIELAQRLELNLKATTIGSSPGTNKWGFGDFYEQRSSGGEFWKHAYSLAHTYIADDLMNGPQYDVILWPGLHPWDSYPAEIRDAIRMRVENGAGLVLFYPFSRKPLPSAGWDPSPLTRTPDIKSEDSNNFYQNRFESLDHSPWQTVSDHYITRGVPLSLLPWQQIAVPDSKADGQVLLKTVNGNPVLAVKTAGKGRVVAFAYTEKGMIPEIHNVFETGLHYPYHEYLWSLLARAVVWAAGREPVPAIRDLSCDEWGMAASIQSIPPSARLEIRVRNAFGEVEAEGNASVASEGRLRFKFPRLQGGRHMVEARLLDKGQILDWATKPLDVSQQVLIQSLQPGTDRIRVGAEVPVRVRLSGNASGKTRVRIRLFDNYQRMLDEQSLPWTSSEAERSFSLKTAGALTHLALLDCEVLVENLRVDRRIAEIFVLQPRRWDDYDIVMYRFGPDPIPGIWPKIDEQMRRLNVTTLSSYSVNHSKHANYNVQAQTRISGQESPDGAARNYYTAMKKKYLATGDKNALVREFCLDDPAYKERVTAELQRLTEPWVPFSPMSYYVFEEPSLTCYGDAVDICFSPHTMRAMRNWLKSEYRTLERLNQQWGTSFAAWDTVLPDDAPEAQRRGNYASWADHRTWMEITYADTFAFVLEQLRRIDPEGILLNSGTQISGAHNGCDYSRINRYTRHLNAYDDGNQLDFHRCFSPDLKISGGAGYGVLGKNVFYNFYENLFKGSNGGAYVFWQYSTLDPDLTMSQSGKDMERGFRELRGEGIGKLVGLATPDNHGIAIHYSYPSIHGTWIVDGKVTGEVSDDTSATFNRFNDNRDGWVKLLKDSGLQFDFIDYGRVEAGGLWSGKYSTFIMPMSVALSNKEVEAIREFVRRGGTLLADALPGVMDERCTFRAVRPLLDVFGVQAPPGSRDALIRASGEPELHLVTARSLSMEGNRPTLISHRYGQGRAYLLNYFLHGYAKDRLEGRAEPVRKNLSSILNEAGIRPKIRLSGSAGEQIGGCATYLFNLGSTRLLGLVPDKKVDRPRKIRLSFDGPGAIYDVRRKTLVGQGTQWETIIQPGVPGLFAIVEEPVEGIDIGSADSVRPGDELLLQFTIRGGRELRSVARIDVRDPSGKRIAHYSGNEDIIQGKGSVRFRTALNDPRGVWRVVVAEVISGKRAEVQATVRPASVGISAEPGSGLAIPR